MPSPFSLMRRYEFVQTTPIDVDTYSVQFYDDTGLMYTPPSPSLGFGLSISPDVPSTNAPSAIVTSGAPTAKGLVNVVWEIVLRSSEILSYSEFILNPHTNVEATYKSIFGVNPDNSLLTKLYSLVYSLQKMLPCFVYSSFTNDFEKSILDEGLLYLLHSHELEIDPSAVSSPLIQYSQGDTVYKYAQPPASRFGKNPSVAFRDRAYSNLKTIPCFDEYFMKGKYLTLMPTTTGFTWCNNDV